MILYSYKMNKLTQSTHSADKSFLYRVIYIFWWWSIFKYQAFVMFWYDSQVYLSMTQCAALFNWKHVLYAKWMLFCLLKPFPFQIMLLSRTKFRPFQLNCIYNSVNEKKTYQNRINNHIWPNVTLKSRFNLWHLDNMILSCSLTIVNIAETVLPSP